MYKNSIDVKYKAVLLDFVRFSKIFIEEKSYQNLGTSKLKDKTIENNVNIYSYF